MVNQALIDVVKNQLAGGVGEQEIREFLRRRGTSDEEIREIFSVLSVNGVSSREADISSLGVFENAPSAVSQGGPASEATSLVEPGAPLQPISEPVVSASVTTIAHGVEREVPPLQPSVPFVVATQAQSPAIEPISVVLPPVSDRKRRIVSVAFLVGLCVLLLSGGLYAYLFYFASPEQVMDRMMSNVSDVRSAAFSVEFTATTGGARSLFSSTSTVTNPLLGMFATQEGPVTSKVTVSGAFDLLDEADPKVLVDLQVTMDKWPLGDFVLGAEYRNLARKNYIKVNDVPDLGFFSLAFLKNKWFVIEDKEAKAQLGASDGSSDALVPTITQEQRKQLADAWRTNRFLVVEERLAAEDIDGVSMHHYQLRFDKQVYRAWVVMANAIMQAESVDQAKFDATLADLTVSNMEIWIGKQDGLPHRFTAQASLRNSADPVVSTVTINAKDFGEVQSIGVPEGAQSFESVLQSFFGQMLSAGTPTSVPATPQERNEQRRRDITAIAGAIRKNMADNAGTFACSAGPLPQKATFLGAAGFGMSGYAIESCLVPRYLPAMPKDPTKGGLGMSGYSAYYDPATKKVTVRAPYAEIGTKITITK